VPSEVGLSSEVSCVGLTGI